jgi:NDP-sugar pyrophosphorylase family protein
MPIGDYPILEVVIRQLASYDFGHVTIAVNHHAELIKAFFGDGSKWRLRIDYSREDEPLGTMGPIRLIGDLPDHFLVMNGDILTDLNFLLPCRPAARTGIHNLVMQRGRRSTRVLQTKAWSSRGFQEKP